MESVKLTRHLLKQGYDHNELARLLRGGAIRSVRRGAYVLDAAPASTPEVAHREQIIAAIGQLRTPAVVSHMSAALLHGLPLWNTGLTRVHVTRPRENGGHIDDHVHLHVAPLTRGEVTEVDGIPVTDLARTVCDLARGLSMFQATPIGDAALAAGLESDRLIYQLARCKGWPGVVRARRTIGFLDPRSESPGESCSRVRMLEMGLPIPELQYEVFDDLGFLVGRADFAWIKRRTLGEFDGEVKYGALLAPGQSVEDVIREQNAREEALRAHGWELARWKWPVLQTPLELKRRIEEAFRLSAGRHGNQAR